MFSWPGGVWAATNRTSVADAFLTFVRSDLGEFRSFPGPSAMGTPFDQVRELAGQGKSLWAATDLGVARVDPADDRIELVDEGRGLPDSRVYSIASRGGRITVGTERGIARVSDSLDVERIAPSYTDAAYAVFPAGDSVWVGTPAGIRLALPGLARPGASRGPRLSQPPGPGRGFRYLGDTLVALTQRWLSLARSEDPPLDARPQPLGAARPPASLRA